MLALQASVGLNIEMLQHLESQQSELRSELFAELTSHRILRSIAFKNQSSALKSEDTPQVKYRLSMRSRASQD